MKALVGLAALAAMSAKAPLPANTAAGIDPLAMPEVVQVMCQESGGYSSGSAFYVGPKTLVSVAHVTSSGICAIHGKPFTVIAQQGDFTVLRVTDAVTHWLEIDCTGFLRGQVYTAWGFARGLPTLTSVDAEAKGEMFSGFSRLWGVFHAVPGQSGGPFVDPVSRKAVGTVNIYDHRRGDSGSVALKDTSLCRS